MSNESRIVLRWPTAIAGVVGFIVLGGGLAYLALRPQLQRSTASTVPPPATVMGTDSNPAHQGPTGSPEMPAQMPDIVVTMTPEAAQRAGIVLTTVMGTTGEPVLRLPGVVQANAYKQVAVTPLVGGRITRVLVALGQNVGRGQPLAEIFSPELTEAETRYVSIRAELDAHERELQRTEKLVEIGASSRQELERLHAEHAAKLTTVESARSRLELLGVPPATIETLGSGGGVGATTTVAAPIAGVITERAANPGVNVDPTFKMFAVVDLSNVWVVADAYETDFSRVRAGAAATLTTRAYQSDTLHGRVTYIDPQVNAETRTAKVRVEVPNPGARLRLGMFAEVSIESSEVSSGVRVPRSAIQNVGDRTVVYLADPQRSGSFVEREIRLGAVVGNDVRVLSGLQVGDVVVSDGSFYVRAERDRLGLRPANPTGASPASEQNR